MKLDDEKLDLHVFTVDHVTVGPEWKTGLFPPVSRVIPYTRIYLPVAGEGRVECYGKQYTVQPGKILLIPPFADARVHCENFLEKYWLHCNVMLPETRSDVFFLYGDCIELDISDQLDYCKRLFEILLHYKEREVRNISLHHFEVRCALRMLLLGFFHVLSENIQSGPKHEKLRLLQYINKNLHKKITLSELSKVACLHPNYLCSSFHKRMGMTLFDYINKVRMQHALEFFRSGGMTVSEVAEKTGYSSIQAFSKKFRKYFGVSPRQSPFFYKGDLKFPPEAEPPF